MLLPLVLSLIAPTAASPILSPPKTVDAKPPDDSTSTRTVYSIVWSCLTTVFACTWIAIHPNIPSPTDSQKRKILRRVGIMLVAIMAPEYVAVWALRQWLSAREITKRMRAMSDGPPNWTITHSFFLVMGGFMLVDESGVLKGTLTHQWMEELKEKNLIAFPSIAEKEIQDKSKGDALSKVILLLQISWFLLQVVARAIRNLPITELELVTVAFASLNLFAYSFWWKKPLNVDCPVEVRLNLPSAPAEVPDTSSHPEVESAQPNESSPLTMDITSIPLSAGPDSPTESDLTPLPGVPSISARENVSSMPFAIVEKPLWNDSFPPPCYDGTSTESEFKLIFELDWLRAVTEPNTTNSWTDNFFPHTVNFTPYWLPPASELATNPSDLTGHPSLPLVSPHVNTTRVIHADKEGPSDSFPLSSEFNARRNSVEITSHFSAERLVADIHSSSTSLILLSTGVGGFDTLGAIISFHELRVSCMSF
uniref:Uncharacterized protein n=1 Tax=Moniliophthora roreri TaxID=221103 RepID=A0A0W0FG53_MONRR